MANAVRRSFGFWIATYGRRLFQSNGVRSRFVTWRACVSLFTQHAVVSSHDFADGLRIWHGRLLYARDDESLLSVADDAGTYLYFYNGDDGLPILQPRPARQPIFYHGRIDRRLLTGTSIAAAAHGRPYLYGELVSMSDWVFL